jgi:hypothetical protein
VADRLEYDADYILYKNNLLDETCKTERQLLRPKRYKGKPVFLLPLHELTDDDLGSVYYTMELPLDIKYETKLDEDFVDLLVQGYSVAECADILDTSISTLLRRKRVIAKIVKKYLKS